MTKVSWIISAQLVDEALLVADIRLYLTNDLQMTYLDGTIGDNCYKARRSRARVDFRGRLIVWSFKKGCIDNQ